MHPTRPLSLRRTLLALLLAPLAFAATAQPYPNKPIKVLVPYAAGGGADTNARAFAQHMATTLGQPVLIENRPGASGVIAAQAALQAAPDGYTVLYDTFPYAVNAVLRKLPFDPLKDLVPVSQAINMPNILVVNSASPFKTLKDLVADAKAHPGKQTYASYGAGGAAHIAAEMLRAQAGIEWVHVPYRGGAPAITDLLGGQVGAYFANPVSGLSYIQAGKLRALAVTSATRMATLPDVPSMAESGYKDFELTEWNGFFVRAGTPPELVDRLAKAVRAAAQDPELKQRLAATGIEAVGSSPADFGKFLQGQIARWQALVKVTGITVE